MEGFRPMLASHAPKDFSKLKYPLFASPKIDGYRCLLHPALGPVARSLKPIPNDQLREMLSLLPPGLDGELAVSGDPAQFHLTMSRVRRRNDPPFEVVYYVFDYFLTPASSFEARELLARTLIRQRMAGFHLPVESVVQRYVANADELHTYLDHCMEQGFEGVMIRDPTGVYKFGRSTVREGGMLKVKPLDMDTGVVLRTEQLQRNHNVQVRNELGYASRPVNAAGKVGDELVGKLVLDTPQWGEVKVGSGLTDQLRTLWWNRPDQIIGKTVKFQYQGIGSVDKPRCPVFKGVVE